MDRSSLRGFKMIWENAIYCFTVYRIYYMEIFFLFYHVRALIFEYGGKTKIQVGVMIYGNLSMFYLCFTHTPVFTVRSGERSARRHPQRGLANIWVWFLVIPAEIWCQLMPSLAEGAASLNAHPV